MTPYSRGRTDAFVICAGWVVCPVFYQRLDFSFAFSKILEGVESLSPSTRNGLVYVETGASGFPAVDILLVPSLNSVEE